MKKYFILLLLIVLFLVSSFVYAVPANNEKFSSKLYLYVNNANNEPEYIEKQNIFVSKDNNRTVVDFWITYVYTDDIQKQLDVTDRFELDDDAAKKARYTKTHYKINNVHFWSVITVVLYDENDNVMTSFTWEMNYEWKDIFPGTYEERVYNVVWNYLKEQGKI